MNFEAFAEAARLYGATDEEREAGGREWPKAERWPDGTQVLSQENGSGWAIGYDENASSLWLGLMPEGNDWNSNTVLNAEDLPDGITLGLEQGKISSEHPIAVLLAENPDLDVHLMGAHTGWKDSETTRLSLDEDGNLVGNIPEGGEVKVMVKDVAAKWESGNWHDGADQKLTLSPETTSTE